jgi:hypothetical protein
MKGSIVSGPIRINVKRVLPLAYMRHRPHTREIQTPQRRFQQFGPGVGEQIDERQMTKGRFWLGNARGCARLLPGGSWLGGRVASAQSPLGLPEQ